MTDVAAIVLAAGTASRFRAAGPSAASKLVAELDGKALVRHAVEAAAASQARPVIVVTGYERAAVEAALAGLPVRFAFNAGFAAGLSSSLQAGVAALPATAAAAVVLLGDMPKVSAALVDRLIGAWREAPSAPAVVPVLRGERGNPVLLARSLFPAVQGLAGDQGARRLLAADPAVIEVEAADDGVAVDIDTPAALATLRGPARRAS